MRKTQRTILAAGSLVPGVCAAHVPAGESWTGDAATVVVLVLLLAALFLHALGSMRARGGDKGLRSRRGRLAAFWAGCAVLAACLLPPLERWSAALFSAHMVQHELLMLVAAPLLVIARPLPVMLWGMGAMRERIAGLTRTSWAQGAWRFLTHPFTGWTSHAMALWIWHVPAIFRAALEVGWLHDLQHFTFLATALMFWSGLLLTRTAVRHGAGVLYLFTTTVHSGVLGALITFSSRPWYTPALRADSLPDALQDQQLGGLIMWVPGSMIYVAAGLLLLLRWVKAE